MVKKKEKPQEYAKRMLSFIIYCSMVMMFLSYVLAWFGKEQIAEQLSSTIATVIIGVTIPYFITKTVENVSKYGSRINHTTKEQENEHETETYQ